MPRLRGRLVFVRSGHALGMSLLWVASCGGRSVDGTIDSGCDTDLDCKGARICVLKRCEDPDPAGAGTRQTGMVGVTNGGRAVSGGVSNQGGMSSGTGGAPGGAFSGAGRGGAMNTGGAPDVGTTPMRIEVDASALIADPTRGRLYAVV